MNSSKKYGFVWWGTAGCGSRAVSVFMTHSGCDDLYNHNEDFLVWKTLFNRQMNTLQTVVSKAYLNQDISIQNNFSTDLMATQNYNSISLYVLSFPNFFSVTIYTFT